MFDRQAEASRRCRDYAEDAYSAMDGPGPFRNAATGIEFGGGQSEKIREAIALYESTDMEIAAMLWTQASTYRNAARRFKTSDDGRSSNRTENGR